MSTVAESTKPSPQFDDLQQQGRAATLGLWIFLATELMFFGPLFFGYAYGRMHYAQGFAVASRHTEVALGTFNTALLLTSSFAMAAAVEARKLDATRLARWMLAATACFGIAFLFIKGIEYKHEWDEHLFPGAGFAYSGPDANAVRYFFFVYFAMTGLHALHLLIGIVAVGVFAAGLARRANAFASPEHIELVGLYWHFVDAIWIFLYPILYLVGRSGG